MKFCGARVAICLIVWNDISLQDTKDRLNEMWTCVKSRSLEIFDRYTALDTIPLTSNIQLIRDYTNRKQVNFWTWIRGFRAGTNFGLFSLCLFIFAILENSAARWKSEKKSTMKLTGETLVGSIMWWTVRWMCFQPITFVSMCISWLKKVWILKYICIKFIFMDFACALCRRCRRSSCQASSSRKRSGGNIFRYGFAWLDYDST